MTDIYFIRHGETEYNQQRRYCGLTDIALSERGVEQVKALRDSNQLKVPDIVFTSFLRRAIETARILFFERQLTITPALAEIYFGKWEGLTHSQILEQYCECYLQWLNDPYSVVPPQGEYLSGFERRVHSFLERILTQFKDTTIICVTHAGTINVCVRYFLNNTCACFWEQMAPAASVTHFLLDFRKVHAFTLA